MGRQLPVLAPCDATDWRRCCFVETAALCDCLNVSSVSKLTFLIIRLCVELTVLVITVAVTFTDEESRRGRE